MRLPPAPDGVSHCYFIYCSWPPVYSLFHVLKFKCGKHYQHPPWIIFFVVVVWGRRRVLFFFSSPSTSFVLWNVSNGQRLASDWLNSKTISFVLMLCLKIHTGLHKARNKDVIFCAHVGAVGWGAQTLWAPWIFSRKKEKDCKGTLGSQGSRLSYRG